MAQDGKPDAPNRLVIIHAFHPKSGHTSCGKSGYRRMPHAAQHQVDDKRFSLDVGRVKLDGLRDGGDDAHLPNPGPRSFDAPHVDMNPAVGFGN
jgi:hypothetical protein